MTMNTVRPAIIVAASIFAFACASAGVIGTDDRRAPAEDEALLLRALGHVVCSRTVDGVRRRSAGTGTIVGHRNIVLTAAHVLADKAGRRGPAYVFSPVADCRFRQYDESGEVEHEVAFTHSAVGRYSGISGAPDQDWAVLTTERPVSDDAWALPFASGFNDLEGLDGLPISILAFHADVRAQRRTPLLSEGELLIVDYGGDRRLAHTADMGRMSSGAAIVHRTDDDSFVVVGVNRSSANLGNFNLAVPLTSELEATLRSRVWGQVPDARVRVARRSVSPL